MFICILSIPYYDDSHRSTQKIVQLFTQMGKHLYKGLSFSNIHSNIIMLLKS